MTDLTVLLIELFFSIISISIVLIKYLGGQLSIKKALLFTPFLVLLISLCLYSSFKKYSFVFLIAIVTYLYSLVALSLTINAIKWKRKIYIIILFQAISFALSSYTSLITKFFIQNDLLDSIIDISINLAIVICLVVIPQKQFSEKLINFLLFTGKGIKIYIIVLLYSLSFTAIIIAYIPHRTTFNIWYLLIFVFGVMLIVATFLMPLLVSNNISKNYYKRINRLEDEQIITQRIYYKKLLDNYSELRRFKHDYKNQLIVLQSYLEQDNIEYVKQYIKSSNEYVNSLERYHTGCFVFDALLDYKSQKANKHNTSIKCSGKFNPLSLDDVDLCIIFGNALDNAIEACEKIYNETNKTISVTITQQNHLLNVIITNPIYEPPVLDNNTIETSKNDSDNHGFGLYSINRTIKKYDGTYSISCTDNTFSIQICLSI